MIPFTVKNQTAIHEAGHAVIAEVFHPGVVENVEITQEDEGFTGSVQYRNEINESEVFVAGVVATHLLTGFPKTLTVADFQAEGAFLDADVATGDVFADNAEELLAAQVKKTLPMVEANLSRILELASTLV